MIIKRQVEELKKELIDLRRDFHIHPELGFEEFRTSDIVARYVKELGLEVTRMAKTGVVGLLRGKQSGKTLLMRTDMDALPVQEQNDLPYKSQNDNKMHACGHDGHIAMLMVAAKILSTYRDKINGNIKFVFQPNEEDAGAYLMVKEGVMQNPKVDASVGGHLWSLLESGKVDICTGPVMAASYYFYLTIKGKGGHAGFVYQSVDPINVAANIIQAVQAIQTREIDALNPAVIMFTKIHAGSNTTIVPEKVEIQGSIRFLYKGGEECIENFERVVTHVCQAHRANYEIRFKVGNPMLSNDSRMAHLAKLAAEKVVNAKEDVTAKTRTMAGDDFAEFASKVPGVFYFLGVGDKEKGTDYPHHNPHFNIDENTLPLGVEMHVRTALSYFGLDV